MYEQMLALDCDCDCYCWSGLGGVFEEDLKYFAYFVHTLLWHCDCGDSCEVRGGCGGGRRYVVIVTLHIIQSGT